MLADVCDLRSLATGRPGLTPAKGASLAEAAAVCLKACGHESPVDLQLHGDREGVRKLVWHDASTQDRDTYADIPEATEEGACAIALSVIESTLGMVVVERSRKNSAFDYWLGDEPDSMMQRSARLEVTGILHGDPALIQRRLSEKLARYDRYPDASRAIVAVVEFSAPQALVVTR